MHIPERSRILRHRVIAVLFGAFLLTSPLFAQSTALAANAFPAPVPSYLAGIINDAGRKYGVDPNLIAAMAFRESQFKATAVSSRGAQGIMQLMPRTARSLGVLDSFDPQQNV